MVVGRQQQAQSVLVPCVSPDLPVSFFSLAPVRRVSVFPTFADISRTLGSALHFGEPLTGSTPLFLPASAHTRLVCQACSHLLTWKGLPRAFGEQQDEASRQLLPLSVAADVAASQTGADPGSFRDTLTGTQPGKQLRRLVRCLGSAGVSSSFRAHSLGRFSESAPRCFLYRDVRCAPGATCRTWCP